MDRDSRRLPAFGRDLVLARRRNREPDLVHVLVGDDWTPPPDGVHVLAVRCEHWRPGAFDWTPCAGLPIVVHERGVHPRSTAPHATSLLERIAAELIRHAAIVQVQFSNNERWDIEAWARWQRESRRDRRWPEWWSDWHANRAASGRQAYLSWLARVRDDRFLTVGRQLLATSPL